MDVSRKLKEGLKDATRMPEECLGEFHRLPSIELDTRLIFLCQRKQTQILQFKQEKIIPTFLASEEEDVCFLKCPSVLAFIIVAVAVTNNI